MPSNYDHYADELVDDNECANFKDDFDWSILPLEYLEGIGAVRNGSLREKPKHRSPSTHRGLNR